ncbi:Rieske (2Fe-2S) protein [Mucilaginibacter sp. RS28]|uniref:Rieske (2Fe-2S) protein n=1 Tax=Mucilaginibacter straminoryzae TaxID=2932774 RepID=A0A9X1X7Q6_9SPHI|nr:Rieske (2Fe-2S) protein [Mucilaginibacter straminoryzae]MCJ8211228.1 Rieske (2Fe-2S) protein [Mucilaginibacter straminoryzae]
MKWFSAGKINPEAKITKVKAGSKNICLVYNDDKYYALASRCPHAGADLSGGWCKEGKLVCPVHRFTYDLQTGRGGEGQFDFVPTYPVKIKNGEVFVGVSSFWERLKAIFKS